MVIYQKIERQAKVCTAYKYVGTNFIMSYKQFVTDLNKFYKDNNNKGTHYEIGQTIIRDNWLKDGRFDELIDFVLENWDSGNCDDFIEPLEKKLIAESHINRYKRLWTKIISYRLKKYTNALENYLKLRSKPNISELEKFDTSKFNMFSSDSYKDAKIVLSFHRKFLLTGLQKYKAGLLQLKADSELEKVTKVAKLEPIKLEVKNWC